MVFTTEGLRPGSVYCGFPLHSGAGFYKLKPRVR